MCDIIPDGLQQDGSGEIMDDGGRQKWDPWVSLVYFLATGDMKVGEEVMGSHRSLGSLLSFTS